MPAMRIKDRAEFRKKLPIVPGKKTVWEVTIHNEQRLLALAHNLPQLKKRAKRSKEIT